MRTKVISVEEFFTFLKGFELLNFAFGAQLTVKSMFVALVNKELLYKLSPDRRRLIWDGAISVKK